MTITLLILAYNDGLALPGLIKEISLETSLIPQLEVIIVNDGSSDTTQEVADQLARDYPFVKAIHHPVNRGVGAGMRSGILASGGEWVGYMDGDAQYYPSDVTMIQSLFDRADVISGIRVKRADPFKRLVVSRVWAFILKHIVQSPFRDMNSGLKFYKRTVLEVIGPPESPGPFYDAEMMMKSVHAGFTVLEHPIRHRPRKFGQAAGASVYSIRRTIRELFSPVAMPLHHPDWIGHLLCCLKWFK